MVDCSEHGQVTKVPHKADDVAFPESRLTVQLQPLSNSDVYIINNINNDHKYYC